MSRAVDELESSSSTTIKLGQLSVKLNCKRGLAGMDRR